jgi:hypothetical protein
MMINVLIDNVLCGTPAWEIVESLMQENFEQRYFPEIHIKYNRKLFAEFEGQPSVIGVAVRGAPQISPAAEGMEYDDSKEMPPRVSKVEYLIVSDGDNRDEVGAVDRALAKFGAKEVAKGEYQRTLYKLHTPVTDLHKLNDLIKQERQHIIDKEKAAKQSKIDAVTQYAFSFTPGDPILFPGATTLFNIHTTMAPGIFVGIQQNGTALVAAKLKGKTAVYTVYFSDLKKDSSGKKDIALANKYRAKRTFYKE